MTPAVAPSPKAPRHLLPTRFLDERSGSLGTFWSSIAYFGLPLDALFAAFWASHRGQLHADFLVPYLFGILWLNLAPWLLWCFEYRLLPAYFERAAVVTGEDFGPAQRHFQRLFGTRYAIVVLPWALVVFGLFWSITPAQPHSGFGHTGLADPWFWTGCLVVAWTVLLTGIGIWGVTLVVPMVRAVASKTIRIDPLHPDGVGGIGFMGVLAAGSAALFSSGSLFLPGFFRLTNLPDASGAREAAPNLYAYLMLGVFVGCILFCILYPTVVIHLKARKERYSRMQPLWRTYRDARDRRAPRSQVDWLREEYEALRDVSLYPFKTQAIAGLTSSVLLPVAFMLLQTYVLNG